MAHKRVAIYVLLTINLMTNTLMMQEWSIIEDLMESFVITQNKKHTKGMTRISGD
ncbi:hypothetical protein L1D35_20155 [Vibrio harveyi]|nr:hypothetical protein [Vibrio harveyi]